MNPPIIFFHQSFAPYMVFSLWQARQSNPQSPIILLGDETNKMPDLDVTHVPFLEYSGRRNEFLSLYRHFSGHELECERLCFERWFHLAAFLDKEKIDQCVFLDTDVLLFAQLAGLIPAWNGFDGTGTPDLIGFCYISRRKIISDFADYIIDRYRDPGQIRQWERGFKEGEDQPDGTRKNVWVTDMRLSEMYLKATSLNFYDLRVPRNGWVFDRNISSQDGCEMDLSLKPPLKRLCQGQAGGVVEACHNGQPVRMGCLHLVGKVKRNMSAWTGWSKPVVTSCLRSNYRRNIKKLIQHYYFGKQYARKIRGRCVSH